MSMANDVSGLPVLAVLLHLLSLTQPLCLLTVTVLTSNTEGHPFTTTSNPILQMSELSFREAKEVSPGHSCE